MIRKIISISSMASCLMLVLSTIFPAVTFAAGSRIYVTPTSGALQPGQSITIQVKGDIATGTFYGADTVSGTLQFPANLLKVTSVSTSGATFNWQVSATPGNGVVTFNERAFFASDNTSVSIMSVTFQALAAGTANLSFSGSTQFSSSAFGTGFATALAGGSYAISNPPPTACPSGQVGTPPNCTTPPPATCPSGQVGTPPNCTTPVTTCPSGQTGTPPNCKAVSTSPPITSTPTTTNTPPNASPGETAAPAVIPSSDNDNGLSISDTSTSRSYKTATLSWKTSIASKNTVAYGTTLKSLTKTAEVTKLPDGTYEAKLAELVPGKQYYFTITANGEADSTKTDSYSGVFTTKGFPVAITVTTSGSAVANAKVKIGEQTYSTDKAGQLSLELASGSYDVAITSTKGNKNTTMTVAAKTISGANSIPPTQKFTFDIPVASSDSGLSVFTVIGMAVGGVALLALIGGLLVLARRRRERTEGTLENPLTVDNNYNWTEAQPLPAFPQEQVSASTTQQMITPEEAGYTDSAMMPPEVPLAPIEQPSSFEAGPIQEVQQVAPADQPASIEEMYTEPEVQSINSQEDDSAETAAPQKFTEQIEQEITTPPPPPIPEVPIEEDVPYAAPDAESTPLPPEESDGEPDAEIIGSELLINHHHNSDARPSELPK